MTRIATRVVRSTPTGIDRTEFAYAKELLFHRPDLTVIPVLTTPWFSGAISPGLARRVLQRVEVAWQAPTAIESDMAFQRLLPHLGAPPDETATSSLQIKGRPRSQVVRRGLMFPIGEVASAAQRLSRATRDLPKGAAAAYIHTSHTQLEHISRFRWPETASIKRVFFLHDVIPIDYPEYCSPGAAPRHWGRLKTVSETADLILVNSEYTADRTRWHLDQKKWRAPRISVVPLGVEEVFLTPEGVSPVRVNRPYFVYVGTIEPRKNLTFLLAVWRDLASELGSDTPKLIIVGRRGWENENVVDILERSTQLAPHVIEVSGLSDRGLTALVAGSAALVTASFVEGFGLPLIESAAAGAPLIVSDIPAHREVIRQGVTFVGASDGPGWTEAIKSHSGKWRETNLGQRVANASSYRSTAQTWRSHVTGALRAVAELFPIKTK